MATVPQAITVNGSTYTVPGSDTIEPLAASVSYDGTGASGAFMPCLSIYSQDGHLISRTFPQSSVAMGSSAEVSFIPFVPPASGSAAGGGIDFDIDNVGGSLQVETTGAIASDFTQPNSGNGDVVGYGTGFNSANGFYMTNLASSGQFVLTLESFATLAHAAIGLQIDTEGVTGPSKALDISYGNSTATNSGQNGITVSGVSKTNAGHGSIAISGSDSQQGTADNIGVQGSAGNVGPGVPTGGSFFGDSGNGDAIGVKANALATGGTAFAVKVVAGYCDLNLPVVAGPTGTLWNNGGIVTVA